MPKRKPIALKRLQGTDRPDRATYAPDPSKEVSLRVPAGLSPEAKAFWRKIAPELQRLGLLTTLDLGSLQILCQAWGFAQQGAASVIETGILRPDENKVMRKAPGLLVFRDAAAMYKSWCAEFGLSPKARNVIDAPIPAPDPAELFRKVLYGGLDDDSE